jgi:hypothetical protein
MLTLCGGVVGACKVPAYTCYFSSLDGFIKE